MELSKGMLEAVSIAGDIYQLSDDEFALVLAEISSTVANVRKPFDAEVNFGAAAKVAIGGLMTLFLEAARHDCDSNFVSSVLEECKVESGRAAKFVKLYEENKEYAVNVLSRIGRYKPHIVDVNWRQDLVIKTNTCEKIGEPTYIISLKTLKSSPDSIGNITFGCTLEQLQDLVFKLKDATKSIERLASH